jgi:AAA domain
VAQALWIGGPPASGKTTVATRIARRHGLRLYSADTRTWEHRDRALAAGHAAARRWESLTPAERWERSTPAEMLEMSLHRERGQMVLDDLAALPDAPLVIAEGSTLPARAADPTRAIWLIPTPELQRARLAAQGTTGGAAELYALLNDVIAREAADHAVPTLLVDGSRDIEETVAAVEGRFADAIAAGPRAQTTEERRALLREINGAIVAQVQGYYARSWARGDPDAVVRSFVCECGDPACTAELELTVGAIRRSSAGPDHRG